MTIRKLPLWSALVAVGGVLAVTGVLLWQRGASDVPRVSVADRVMPGPAAVSPVAGAVVNRVGSAEVPVRVYEPEGVEPWGTLVWAHGGSFTRGTLDWPESDWAAHEFAAHGLRVYAVDYVLASDTVKAPAPARDVAAVLAAVADEHDGAVFVGGASAGAHLAAEAALEHSDLTAAGRLRALLLVYPTAHRVHPDRPDIAALTSQLEAARQFGPHRLTEMYDFYLGGSDPAAIVVGEQTTERLGTLPSTAMVHAEADDLRASGEQLGMQLREAAVHVTEHVVPGTVHGYLNRPHETPQSLQDAQISVQFLAEAARVALAS